jgi:hypothetical protein
MFVTSVGPLFAQSCGGSGVNLTITSSKSGRQTSLLLFDGQDVLAAKARHEDALYKNEIGLDRTPTCKLLPNLRGVIGLCSVVPAGHIDVRQTDDNLVTFR